MRPGLNYAIQAGMRLTDSTCLCFWKAPPRLTFDFFDEGLLWPEKASNSMWSRITHGWQVWSKADLENSPERMRQRRLSSTPWPGGPEPTDTRVAHILSFLIPYLSLTALACRARWPGNTQGPAETQAFPRGPCVPLLTVGSEFDHSLGFRRKNAEH